MAVATSYADTQKLLKHPSPNLTNKFYTNVDPVLRHAVDASFARHTAISARRISRRDVQRRPDFPCIKDGRCFYVEVSCNCKDATTKETGLSGRPPTKINKVNNHKEESRNYHLTKRRRLHLPSLRLLGWHSSARRLFGLEFGTYP